MSTAYAYDAFTRLDSPENSSVHRETDLTAKLIDVEDAVDWGGKRRNLHSRTCTVKTFTSGITIPWTRHENLMYVRQQFTWRIVVYCSVIITSEKLRDREGVGWLISS